VTAPALELRGVKAAYGRIEVLHGVDLVVPSGSVFALLGPNGAGKSTTLKVVNGRMTPTAGCVHIAGTHVNGGSTARLARAGVCSIPEGRGIFPNLSVDENLLMATYSAGGQSAEDVRDKAFERFPRLAERRKQVAGTLSGGEQQMLAMARALSVDPALLLLDELSMGLAPIIVEHLYEAVKGLAAEGISILLVEQFARVALPVADYVAVMLQGKVAHAGEPGDIAGDLQGAYLGGSAA
jgi:branched-chain amino acid transport system ATP-binding protein